MNTISELDIQKIVERIMRNMTSIGINDTLANSSAFTSTLLFPKDKTVAVGSDHGAFEMKEFMIRYLKEDLNYRVIDCGTYGKQPVDYPDFAFAVADKVRTGAAWRGIMIDGAGIGSCMAANKVPGVRAAMCYDYATAVNSREHNNANVLTFGSGLLGRNQVKLIVKTWLETEFGGGRHIPRVNKVMEIEKKFGKRG